MYMPEYNGASVWVPSKHDSRWETRCHSQTGLAGGPIERGNVILSFDGTMGNKRDS